MFKNKWTISASFLLLCVALISGQSNLTLEWRQPLIIGPTAYGRLPQPPDIKESLFIQGTTRGIEYLVFDNDGQLQATIIGRDGARWRYSQDQSVVAMVERIHNSLSATDEDSPSTITAFVRGVTLWQRQVNSTTITSLSNTSLSVDLDYAVTSMTFYDTAGRMIRSVFPFGRRLPWSFERPAVAAWSPDSGRFAVVAVDSEIRQKQAARLFLYDSGGRLLYAEHLAPLTIPLAVGVSRGADAIMVVGTTENPGVHGGPTVQGVLLDREGRNVRAVTIPAVGDKIVIAPVDGTTDFIIDNTFDMVLRLGVDHEPVVMRTGQRARVGVAANAELTALAILEPPNPGQANRAHLRILNRSGSLLHDYALDGNTLNLKNLKVWLAYDRRLLAIQFADEIRYYRLTL